MLQCNRYPGLDANEIIRLTSAIGQLRTVTNPWAQSSGRLLYFGSCRKANSHNSAEADLGYLSRLGRQCAGYLPFSRKSR